MQIVYHLGVHCTDEERLLRCLLKNRGALAAKGIVVPGPARYRTLLRDTAMTLKGQPASRDTQSLVLDQIMTEDDPDRLILSWDHFLGYAAGAVRTQFYAAGPERMKAFGQVFPGYDTEFHLAIRNPATFLPAIYQKQRGRSIEEFMEGVEVSALRWSELIEGLRRMNPTVPVTVWCDEDTPLIWPEVLRAVSGHGDDLVLEDTSDLLATIMSVDGMQRMQGYMATHPPQTVAQRRRIVTAFLDKFALPDKIEMEFEMPGWTPELTARISAAYDNDVARIRAMNGVTFIAA